MFLLCRARGQWPPVLCAEVVLESLEEPWRGSEEIGPGLYRALLKLPSLIPRPHSTDDHTPVVRPHLRGRDRRPQPAAPIDLLLKGHYVHSATNQQVPGLAIDFQSGDISAGEQVQIKNISNTNRFIHDETL